jgi:hypothetical protein
VSTSFVGATTIDNTIDESSAAAATPCGDEQETGDLADDQPQSVRLTDQEGAECSAGELGSDDRR